MAANPNNENVPNQCNTVTISNQTVTTAYLVPNNYWAGQFKDGPTERIQPQEIGKFIDGDVGAVVYRSKNAVGTEYDWVFAWYNYFVDSVQKSAVYTDIIPSDNEIYDDQYWAKVKTKLQPNPPKVIVIKYGCMSVATINDELPAKFNGTMVTLN